MCSAIYSTICSTICSRLCSGLGRVREPVKRSAHGSGAPKHFAGARPTAAHRTQELREEWLREVMALATQEPDERQPCEPAAQRDRSSRMGAGMASLDPEVDDHVVVDDPMTKPAAFGSRHGTCACVALTSDDSRWLDSARSGDFEQQHPEQGGSRRNGLFHVRVPVVPRQAVRHVRQQHTISLRPGLHGGTASARTRSRSAGRRPASVIASTRRPSHFPASVRRLPKASAPVPGLMVTRRSTSLSSRASPRLIAPKTLTLVTHADGFDRRLAVMHDAPAVLVYPD